MFPPLARRSEVDKGRAEFGPGTVGIYNVSGDRIAAARILKSPSAPQNTHASKGTAFDSFGTEAWWFNSAFTVAGLPAFPAVGTFRLEWPYTDAPSVNPRTYSRWKRSGTDDPEPQPTRAESNTADAFVIVNHDASEVAVWCYRELRTAGGNTSVIAEHWVTTEHWVRGESGDKTFIVMSSPLSLQGVVRKLGLPSQKRLYYHHNRPATP
jgi:hypothetical protein